MLGHTQTPIPNSEKVERVVFIPKTMEDNKKAQALKHLAQKEKTTIYALLLETIELIFAKRGLNALGQPDLSLLNFEHEKPKKQYTKCYFHNCKEIVTYQAYNVYDRRTVGLCKIHIQAVHKPNTANWNWKNFEHLDTPKQPLCDLCVEVSAHYMFSVSSNRVVPLCDKHYQDVQESIAAGNKKWCEYRVSDANS